MAWITPVTDRTAADVTALNEKGKLTHTVANRIESNTEYLSDLLDSLGYNNAETHVTDWDRPDIVYVSDIERIRNNVETLTEVYSKEHALTFADLGSDTFAETGSLVYKDLFNTSVPVTMRTHYEDFNDLETALSGLKNMVDRMTESFEYCGEVYAGEW